MQVTPLQCLGISSEHLVSVGKAHKMHPVARQAFSDMQAAAVKAGIDCQLFSSFRDFDKQCSIWDRKWRGELPLYDINNVRLDPSQLTDTEKLHAILLWSALPGASRHHWGTDIDVYDKRRVEADPNPFNLISDEYQNNGPCAQLSQWLDEHAESFGFYRPYARFNGGIGAEPWHLSYAPIAKLYEQQLDPRTLLSAITEAGIQGLGEVRDHFDEIFHRYVLNRGIAQ